MKKIAIIHGELRTGVQKKAIAVLSELLLDATGAYPECFRHDERMTLEDAVRIYVGTRENNPALAAFALAVPQKEQGYILRVKDGVVLIEGYDDAGALYGCMDFYNEYMVSRQYTHNDHYYVGAFDKPLTDFERVSSPAIRERGIWTWGHVIYDWRGMIDNMVKLKMNTLIVWNDRVPVNAAEMVAYAHDCGVRIIWGYAWLWDTNCRAADFRHLEDHCEEIFAQYEREYAALGGDGIYFQTVTEMDHEVVDGVVVADAVTSFVNRTARLFFEKYPSLEIQFGLHATSVKTRLDSIAKVDPRIRIVWEDCGSFPFAYHPDRIGNWGGDGGLCAHRRASARRWRALRRGDQGLYQAGLVRIRAHAGRMPPRCFLPREARRARAAQEPHLALHSGILADARRLCHGHGTSDGKGKVGRLVRDRPGGGRHVRAKHHVPRGAVCRDAVG